MTVAKVLDHDSLEQSWSDGRVPDAFGIDYDDGPIAADAEARRLTALDAAWSKEESFALQERRKQLIQLSATLIWRTEPAHAHEHMARVRVHRGRRFDRRRHEGG